MTEAELKASGSRIGEWFQNRRASLSREETEFGRSADTPVKTQPNPRKADTAGTIIPYVLSLERAMNIAVLGIDLGKNLCSVVGVDETGAVVLRRRMRHQTIVQYASGLPPCVMAMEACCGAHHLGRILQAQGHEIRLMSPEYVRPYLSQNRLSCTTPNPREVT